MAETAALQDEIMDLEDTLANPRRIKSIIIEELTEVRKKYAVERRTEIIYAHEAEEIEVEEEVEDSKFFVFSPTPAILSSSERV